MNGNRRVRRYALLKIVGLRGQIFPSPDRRAYTQITAGNRAMYEIPSCLGLCPEGGRSHRSLPFFADRIPYLYC